MSINDLERLLEEKYSAEHYDDKYEKYSEFLEEQISNVKIFKLPNENSYNRLVVFIREILKELGKNSVCSRKREEVEKYISINDCFKNIDSNVRWIGINVEQGIHPLIPESLVWSDFKVIWNQFARYAKVALYDWSDSIDKDMEYERIKDKKSLEIQYITSSMERMVLVCCITFIESYLYNTRIVIRDNPIFRSRIEDNNLNSVLKNDKINDTQIIEDILFKIYPELKDIIYDNYEVYRRLLKLRDKYIHVSVREAGDGQPEMKQLMSTAGLNIEMKVKYVLDIIESINKIIWDSEEINLLWWKKDESCNFVEFELFKSV